MLLLTFCRPVEPLRHRGQRKINIDILVTMETWRSPKFFFRWQEYTKTVEKEVKGTTVTCSPLYNSIRTLRAAATKVNSEQKVLSLENCCSSYAELTVYHTAFCALMTKRHEHFQELQKQLLSKQLNKDSLKIRQLNDRLMQTERAFTSREGIFKLEWFKHLVSRYSCAKHSPSSLEIA